MKSTAVKKRVQRTGSGDDPIILLENVSKSYTAGVPALNGINLHINKGEFVFVVGDSGSGKSTLIKLLLRELVPTSGRIFVNGTDVVRLKRRKIPKFRRSLGVVFQDFRLLKDRNVYENVAFAQRIIQMPSREIRKNVPAMLSRVGLAGKYKAKPKQLSGGEQQRVALARATLCCSPPDSCFGFALYFPASPTLESIAGTFLRISLLGICMILWAKATFSYTLRSFKSLKSWNTTPRLLLNLGILRRFRRTTSVPFTKILPEVGTSSLSKSLISVDLPDPLSPTTKTNSPLFICRLIPFNAGTPAV